MYRRYLSRRRRPGSNTPIHCQAGFGFQVRACVTVASSGFMSKSSEAFVSCFVALSAVRSTLVLVTSWSGQVLVREAGYRTHLSVHGDQSVFMCHASEGAR